MSSHDYNRGVIFFMILNGKRQVETTLVLTCRVHDVVYQVCEPGRGLVRQQVGEKIPGANKENSFRQKDRQAPSHSIAEHDLSHTGVKTNSP